MKKLALVTVIMGIIAIGLTGCGKKDNSTTTDLDKYVKLEQSQYTGIEATKDPVEVTEQDIQNKINTTLQSNTSKTEITDRSIQEGDVLDIAFVGTIDGEEFPGGSSDSYELKIGSNSFIEGFESGLIGHNLGEEVTLNLVFPEDYQSADYAGKDVVFTVTINKIYEESLPEYTDEFVQQISSDYKTTAEYTEYLKNTLQEEKANTAEQNLKYSIWDKVLSNAAVEEAPKETIDKYVDMMNKTYTQYASQTGMELKDFLLTYYGMDMDSYEQNLAAQAESMAKESLVIGYIANKENIVITDDELEKEAESYATQYGYESAAAFLEVADKEIFRENLLNEKVIDFVVGNAKVTE